MNPPFSLKSWGFEDFTDGDPYDRFGYGMPPADNGDYAWMQHVAKSLKPDGKAIIVMSQGILFRGQPKLTEEEDGRNKKADDEYLIRSGFLRDDLIEAIIVLPSGIFYGNNVPACLAIINKRKPADRKEPRAHDLGLARLPARQPAMPPAPGRLPPHPAAVARVWRPRQGARHSSQPKARPSLTRSLTTELTG